jgi:hypothetical protein
MNYHVEQRTDPRASIAPLGAAGDPRVDVVLFDVFAPPAVRLDEADRARIAAMLATLIAAIEADLRRMLPGRVGGSGTFAVLEAAAFFRDRDLAEALLDRLDEGRFAAPQQGEWLQGLPPPFRDLDLALLASFRDCRARRSGEGDRPILPLGDLAADLRDRLIWRVAAAIEVASGDSVDEDVVRRAVAAVIARYADDRSSSDVARALVEAAAAGPAALAALVARGDLAIAAAWLASRLGLPQRIVLRMLIRRGDEMLPAALRAAGLSRADAATVILAREAAGTRYTAEAGVAAEALVAAFETLSATDALAQVHALRRRIADGGARDTLRGAP